MSSCSSGRHCHSHHHHHHNKVMSISNFLTIYMSRILNFLGENSKVPTSGILTIYAFWKYKNKFSCYEKKKKAKSKEDKLLIQQSYRELFTQ